MERQPLPGAAHIPLEQAVAAVRHDYGRFLLARFTAQQEEALRASGYTVRVFEDPDRVGLGFYSFRVPPGPLNLPPDLIADESRLNVGTYLVKLIGPARDEWLSELKILGAEATGAPGSWQSGAAAVKTFLASEGIDTTRIAVADGSGLSRYNLTSTRTIIGLLRAMARKPVVFPAFYRSLPIAGEDGTLANRMRGTRAERLLRAKTGTVAGVSSLSGYTPDGRGGLLAFSMLMQNFPGPTRPYRAVQDSIGALLTGWK